MFKTATAALIGLSLAVGASGGAFAQTGGGAMKPSGGQMMSGKSGMSSKASPEEAKAIKACQAMRHDAMIKDHKCMDMMKMHPDMMKK
jgi:hypothetical protein